MIRVPDKRDKLLGKALLAPHRMVGGKDSREKSHYLNDEYAGKSCSKVSLVNSKCRGGVWVASPRHDQERKKKTTVLCRVSLEISMEGADKRLPKTET